MEPFFHDQETPERVAHHKSQAMGNELTEMTPSRSYTS